MPQPSAAARPATRWARFALGARRTFLFVFFGVFVLLFVQVVFANPHYAYNPVAVVLLAVAWLAAFWLLCAGARRFGLWLQHHEKRALLVFAALLLGTMAFFYTQLACYPTRDFERVFTSAVTYTEGGFIGPMYRDYMGKFPNNMPLTIVLQFVFRLFHRLGYSNFYVIGAALNAGAILLTYAFVYLCARRLWGVGYGFVAMGLLYLCLPLQCYIGVFYTDTLTLCFAPMAFYCYLRLQSAAGFKGRLAAAALLALTLAFGTKLKYSVILTGIALLVDFVLRADFKNLLLTCALFAVLFGGINAGFNAYMYAHFLDPATARDEATPFSAWIMMGLTGNGNHNAADNYLIWDEPTAEAKRQKAQEEIAARLKGFTPATYAAFLNNKALYSFGTGNLAYDTTVAEAPMRQTFLVECVSPGGRYFARFDTLVQGYHVALFGLVTAGAFVAARRRSFDVFVPLLAIFGLLLFLLLWESGPRYLLNYYGMYILAATAALRLLPRLRLRRGKPAAQEAPALHTDANPAQKEKT